ncbi:hypothetical protein KAR91_88005 [Candidatus Pacearchaeota archaeon]|nr:hypothetical protein [Candidatus Pacearchaeota archaeon]
MVTDTSWKCEKCGNRNEGLSCANCGARRTYPELLDTPETMRKKLDNLDDIVGIAVTSEETIDILSEAGKQASKIGREYSKTLDLYGYHKPPDRGEIYGGLFWTMISITIVIIMILSFIGLLMS